MIYEMDKQRAVSGSIYGRGRDKKNTVKNRFYISYDLNGNLTSDTNKGITNIAYNHLNLPVSIDIGSGNIGYIYDAEGVKIQKTVSANNIVMDYANGYIYENGQLQFFDHPEGYVSSDNIGGYDYVYQYVDHLGNIRLSFAEDPNGQSSVTIVEEDNYYPFGLKQRGYNNGGDTSLGNDVAQRWKYNGKEYDPSIGLETYDFGARNYNPDLGRWMNIDPLAEEMTRHSPYNYAFNNPLRFIDPDGMSPDDIIIKGDKKFKQAALAHLQGLTNDKIDLDENGQVVIVSKGSENCDCNLAEGTELVSDLVDSDNTVVIQESNGYNSATPSDSGANIQEDGTPGPGSDTTIGFDPDLEDSGVDENGNTKRDPTIGLGHELQHARDNAQGVRDRSPTDSPAVEDPDGSGTILSKGELKTRKFENKLRKEHGLPARKIKK